MKPLTIIILLSMIFFQYPNSPLAHSYSVQENPDASNSSYSLSWIAGKALPKPRYSTASALGQNGNIYTIGGDNYSCTSLKIVEEFNPSTNNWTRKADLSVGRWSLGAATGKNGKIYAIGGHAGGCPGSVTGANEEYDPVANTWVRKADMPTLRAEVAVVASSNGKIYAIGGGDNSGNNLGTVEEYDPTTNTWRARAGLIIKRRALSAVEANGKIYAIGGGSTVEEYDPSTNVWKTMSSLPAPKMWLGAVTAWNNRVYAIGGNLNTWTDTVFEFEPTANTWRSVARLQKPRRALSAAVANNGKIYAIGGWGPGGIGYAGEGPLSSVEVTSVVESGTSKPVAVLVHGWAGLPGSQGDSCSSDTLPDHITDPNNAPAGDLGVIARNLINDGWDVWTVHIQTSLKFTPPIEDNATCLRSQLTRIPKPDGKVTLIGHSMGGLVSRAYMENKTVGFYLNDVRRLITLGTPHVGTTYGLAPCLANPGDYAACQFSLLIGTFNEAYSTRAGGVSYDLIGGDLTPGTAGVALFVTDGYNDGVVGAESGIGRKYSVFSDPTTIILQNNSSVVKRYKIPASHTSLKIFNVPDQLWFPSFFTIKPNDTNSLTRTYSCIRYVLGIPGGICPPPVTINQADTGASSLTAMEQTPAVTGHLSNGQSTNTVIPIDTNLHSQFDLTWDTGKMQFTLVDPNGKVIDPSYAANHPTEVAYNQNLDDPAIQLFASYSITSTVTGNYTFNIMATDAPVSGLNYRLQGYVESTRQLRLTTDKVFYSPGDHAIITAIVKNSPTGTGLTGASVQGEVQRNGSPLTTLTFLEIGGGIYTALYTIPGQTGILGIKGTAQGSDAGVAYARQADGSLTVRSNTLSLTALYSDSPQDLDQNGKYESLNTNIGVNITQPGAYIGSADLVDSGMNLVAHGVISATLPSGNSNLIIPFLGNEISASKINGLYTLTNLNILDRQNSGVPVVWHAQDLFTTAAYKWTDFATDCFSLIKIVEGAGSVQVTPVPNCNNNTQYAIGTEVTLTAIPGAGSLFSNWNGDINNTDPKWNITLMSDLNITAIFTSRPRLFLPFLNR